MDQFFVEAAPEVVGIPSQGIINFMNQLAEKQIAMHSIIIVRHGKIVTETYYSPYQRDTLHRMFSVTKSFTALAIGLLESEGKLTLDDRIIDHFPEKLPDQIHPYIAEITIRDMLKMATAHARTAFKNSSDPDWVKAFFLVEPSHLPGAVFSYDTSSSHTLAALVEKLSGMPMLDYLRVKFLDEIGFSKDAYIVPDPMGIAQGGSGLMSRPIDLAKVAWIVLREGEYRGKQYLPREFIKDATSRQIDTSVRGGNLDERQGYGYQFWRTRNNGYAMFGMGGQLAVCFPEHDLLLVTTADTQEHPTGVPAIYDAFFNHVLNNLSDQPLPPNLDAHAKLQALINSNQIQPLTGIEGASVPDGVNFRNYLFEENPLGLRQLRLEINGELGKLNFTNRSGNQELAFGLERLVESSFPHYQYRCATSAAWIASDTLIIKSHVIDEEIGMITIQLVFRGDTVTVLMKKVIGTAFNEFAGFVSGRAEA